MTRRASIMGSALFAMKKKNRTRSILTTPSLLDLSSIRQMCSRNIYPNNDGRSPQRQGEVGEHRSSLAYIKLWRSVSHLDPSIGRSWISRGNGVLSSWTLIDGVHEPLVLGPGYDNERVSKVA